MANSNKTGLWILVILVIVGVVAYFLFANGSDDLQGRFNWKVTPKKMEVENADEIMMEPSPLQMESESTDE